MTISVGVKERNADANRNAGGLLQSPCRAEGFADSSVFVL